MRRLFAVLALAAFTALCAQGDDAPFGPDDIKCQVCDYAVRAWARQAIRHEIECMPRAVLRDAQLMQLLPPLNATLFDAELDCAAGKLAKGGIESIAAVLCKDLVLDEYPYVEEFPVGITDIDRDTQFQNPPGYFSVTAQSEGVPPMQPKHVNMVRQLCEKELQLKAPRRLQKSVATVRDAVQSVDFAALDDWIVDRYATEWSTALELAEEEALEAFTKGQVGSDQAADGVDADGPSPDADGQSDTDAEKEQALQAATNAAREKFKRTAKRQAVYDVVLRLQKDLCVGACGAGIERPPTERRVRGWSATLKRL